MRRYVIAVLFVCFFLWPVAFSFGDGWPVVRPVVDLSGWCSTAPAVVPAKSPVAVVREAPAKVVTAAATSVVRSGPYRSPAGYHRHVTQSGVVIEHGDENVGDPIAHAGIDRPWPKYFGSAAPGDNVHGVATDGVSRQANGLKQTFQPVAAPVYFQAAGDCPGGVCPLPQGGVIRRGLFGRRR